MKRRKGRARIEKVIITIYITLIICVTSSTEWEHQKTANHGGKRVIERFIEISTNIKGI